MTDVSQRTTSEAVRDILIQGKQYAANDDLQPFVDTAVVIVDRLEVKDEDSVLNAGTLERIEAWLSAHCYAHAYQLRQSVGKGRSNESFQGQTGMRLESTQYGQTAMVLDFTGYLFSLTKGRARAAATWLGRPPSDQTDYYDRD